MTDLLAQHGTTRWKASALHLVASLVVVGAALLVPLWLWYPVAMWPLAGIDRPLLGLFAAVLLAGPILTLLVYRAGKRTLRFDLCVVVLIQVAFLAYALYMLGRIRPVFLVATADHLELVRAKDIDREDLAEAKPENRALSWTGPRPVGLAPPAGFDVGALLMAKNYGNDYTRRPAYYVDYAQAAPQLLANARSVESVMAGANSAAVSAALANLDRKATQVRIVPLMTSAGTSTAILVDARDATPLQPIRLQP